MLNLISKSLMVKNMENRGAYALQLSDACLSNGLIQPHQVLHSLKINLLFFDWICVSAPALLRNHVLFDVLTKPSFRDHQALAKVYSQGLIRPVVFDEQQNIGTVAKSVASNTINGVGLSDPDRQSDLSLITKHAELISMTGDHRVIAEKPVLKQHFSSLLKFVLSSKVSNGLHKNLTETLLERLENSPSDIRVVDINQILDQMNISHADQRPFRQAAFLAMEWATRPSGSQQFAATGTAAPIIDLLSNVEKGGAARDNASLTTQENLIVPLSVERIDDLSLLEILEARDLPLFLELRNFLHRYRENPSHSLDAKAALKFSELEADFIGWLCGKREIDRKAYLEKIRRKKVGLNLKQVVYLGAVLATGVTVVTGDTDKLLPAGIISAVTAVLDAHALNYEAKTSTVSYEKSDEIMRLNARTGREVLSDKVTGR